MYNKNLICYNLKTIFLVVFLNLFILLPLSVTANDLEDITGEHAHYLKNHTLTIYKYIASVTEINKTQSELKTKGIEVLSIDTGYDGLVYSITKPPSATFDKNNKNMVPGKILILRIKTEDWQSIQEDDFHLCQTLHKKGGDCYKSSYANLFPETHHKKYVLVYKTTGHEQCTKTKEKDIDWNLDKMAHSLEERGVFIYKQYKGTSGEIFALQCGYDTNHINVYVIESSKLGIALSLGFHECAWLKTQGQNCYPYY